MKIQYAHPACLFNPIINRGLIIFIDYLLRESLSSKTQYWNKVTFF